MNDLQRAGETSHGWCRSRYVTLSIIIMSSCMPCATSAGGGDVGKRGLRPGLVGAVVDDDVEAVMRQAPGDGAADTLAGAGDEDRAGHELAGLLISLETSCGW